MNRVYSKVRKQKEWEEMKDGTKQNGEGSIHDGCRAIQDGRCDHDVEMQQEGGRASIRCRHCQTLKEERVRSWVWRRIVGVVCQ
jgi:glutamyl/glutaminyl-tRNA synthetase